MQQIEDYSDRVRALQAEVKQAMKHRDTAIQDYDEANTQVVEAKAEVKRQTKVAGELTIECSQLTQKYDAIKMDLRKLEKGKEI